jgi:hypothetical protein
MGQAFLVGVFIGLRFALWASQDEGAESAERLVYQLFGIPSFDISPTY